MSSVSQERFPRSTIALYAEGNPSGPISSTRVPAGKYSVAYFSKISLLLRCIEGSRSGLRSLPSSLLGLLEFVPLFPGGFLYRRLAGIAPCALLDVADGALVLRSKWQVSSLRD